MPRPQKERKIGNVPAGRIREGLLLIRNGESIRKASKNVGVSFATLKRYHHKFKDAPSLEDLTSSQLEPNYSVNTIFTAEQEITLKKYITHCALLFYGLTAKECRRLAYQCGKLNNLKMPLSWEAKEMAGKDWLIAFRRRHNITLKKPEACSLARATAFNRNNVDKYFDNLENIIARSPHFSDGTRIFNLDETSTTTVQKPQKVLAPMGRKTIGKVTSGERGTLITTCCIISASGNFLPPVMVFPRKNFKDHMIKNTPPGTLGLATPTGWMNSTIFPEVIKHFVKHTNSSKENPSILIMDNHESHLSIAALDLAKNAGVHILTLHPHTSAKLQPLDVEIYGPFKTFYNAAIDSWLLRNPGKPVTIYDLGEIIGSAFQKAMTPKNITSSFAKCGIFPFDRHIFTDEDFLPSPVIDRPCPEDNRDEEASTPDSVSLLDENTPIITITEATASLTSASSTPISTNVRAIPHFGSTPTTCTITSAQSASAFVITPPTSAITSTKEVPALINMPIISAPTQETSGFVTTPSMLTITNTPPSIFAQPSSAIMNSPSVTSKKSSFMSPFEFRDSIKAGPRKSNRKRRAGRSIIATDTPEKARIEQEKTAAKRRNEAKKKKTCRAVLDSDEEEVNQNDEVQLADSEDDINWAEQQEDDDDEEDAKVILTETDLENPLPHSPQEGEYVIVQLTSKRQRLLYIGKVMEERNRKLDYYISFLKRKSGTERFVMPDNPDLSLVNESDLKYILPVPSVVGTSSRPYYNFPIDFSCLPMC